MKRVRGTCRLQDGTVLPDLERWQCLHCPANFFDNEAMKAIAEFRQRSSRTGTVARKRYRPIKEPSAGEASTHAR